MNDLPDPTFIPALTLRDWFAGMIIQGLVGKNFNYKSDYENINEAYRLADLMLEVRNGNN